MATAFIRNVMVSALNPLRHPRAGPGPAALLLRPLPAAAPAGAQPGAAASLLSRRLPPGPPPGPLPAAGLKTRGVLRRRCRDCYHLVKRRGRWFVYCRTNPKHKQRQM